MNDIIKAPLVMGLLGIVWTFGCIYSWLYDEDIVRKIWMSVFLFAYLFIMWHSQHFFWIHKRLHSMTPNYYKKVKVRTDQGEILLRDEDSDIKYKYNVKEKELHITRNMFTNPLRYVKEYEERKRQFELLTERMGILHFAFIAKPENSSSFLVSIILSRSFATPENISKCRDILIELSKEDYNQNLYAKFQYDEDWLYVDTYHFRLLRAMLVSADGEIERYSKDMRPSKVVPNSTPSVRFSFVLNKAAKMSILDKVKPSDIIEKDAFEELWGKDASFLFP